MAVYAIGDVQGCYSALMALLDKLQFSPEQDQLWFAGDLVSRGDNSLAVLRFVHSLGDSAVTVLGNHDISLMAAYEGVLKPHPTLLPILEAEDADELLEWLRFRPLLHVDKKLGYCMAHAGISPRWKLKKAKTYAKEIEARLQEGDLKHWLKQVYGNTPNQWKKTLKGIERQRYIINAFTRMRFCHKDGSLEFERKGPPPRMQHKNDELVPWFNVENRKKIKLKLIFGHWSSLGYHVENNAIGLDTGCIWGNQLTAIRIDTKQEQATSIECINYGR